MRFHMILQGISMPEYQSAHRADPLLAAVDFVGVSSVPIVKLGRTTCGSTRDVFYTQMPISVLLETFLRGETLRTIRALDARWQHSGGRFRLVAVPPVASVDSVRWQRFLAQLTDDVPGKIFHIQNVGLGLDRLVRFATIDRVMPLPMVSVVDSDFEPLRADHALVFVLSVASHVDTKGIARFQLIATLGTNITGLLLAVIFVKIAQ